MLHPVIEKLYHSGELPQLVKGGFMPWTVMRDTDIYHDYDCERKKGCGYNQAIRNTADKWDMSDRQIKRIITKMQA